MIRLMKRVIIAPIDWFLYTFLSENQKKFISGLFTDQQKDRLKRITKHGKRHSQRMKVNSIKHHLYNLGFTDRALTELENVYLDSKDPFMKRLTAWELSLWHTNLYTKKGASKALVYLEVVVSGEKDPDQLKRAAIIEAECLERLGKIGEAKQVIQKRIAIQEHPDLYLAAANLEETIESRVKWINQTFDQYELQPIEFTENETGITYDDLKTIQQKDRIETAPLVSVILPAYNSETGIQIAIESILMQTWRNVELLVVDDCSTDGTVEVVKQYMEKDARIKLYSTPSNSGPYIARNIALKEATGEFVTINDADDWSHAEKIEKQVKHLIANKAMIANTSEHARLTEELKLYRRGTPGIYIFPNMSSLMFRRELVMDKIGFWDSVRFAGDGEFKRRLLRTFGKQNIIDLKTGPLSLPRQSVSSLTGSSAFGYNGFFMGVRKEYVESLEFHHQRANSLYYPYPQGERPFPVPEPMWPNRANKASTSRDFDIIIAMDFRTISAENTVEIKEINTMKNEGKKIGLVQMYHYDITIENEVHAEVRSLIDGDQVQMIVYGEKVSTDILFILDSTVLEDRQKYIPEVDAKQIHVVFKEQPKSSIEDSLENMKEYFGTVGTWHATNEPIRKRLQTNYPNEVAKINLVNKDWENMMHYVK